MTQTRPRTRLAPADRRAIIVDVATRQISERGFNAFTLSRLAEQSGLTRAGIEHHFASKDILLIEVLRRRDELDQRAVFGASDPRGTDEQTVREMLDALVRRNIAQPEIVRLYTILDAESLDPAHPAHDYFVERTRNARRTLTDAARSWHADPELFAVQVLGALDGLQLQWLRDPNLDLLQLWQGASRFFWR